MGRPGSIAFGRRVLVLSVRALTRGGNQPGPVVNSAEEAARAERNANLTKPADEEVVGELEVEEEKLG